MLEKQLDEISVVDINGTTLFQIDTKVGSIRIDMSAFPSGVYFLKYKDSGVWGSVKFQLSK